MLLRMRVHLCSMLPDEKYKVYIKGVWNNLWDIFHFTKWIENYLFRHHLVQGLSTFSREKEKELELWKHKQAMETHSALVAQRTYTRG